MDQTTPTPPLPPSSTVKLSRAKLAWRVLMISNLALGAYLFVKPIKKEPVEEKAKVEAEVSSSTPTETTSPAYEEEPIFSPPVTQPIIVRDPIPEAQQRELFKWILEEKRKVKPHSREEKKKIDEEKAILKKFIHAESIPQI